MTLMTATLLGVHIVSLVVMSILVLEFLHIVKKRHDLMDALDVNKIACLRHGRILIYLYAALTIGIALVTFYLLLWKPDLL